MSPANPNIVYAVIESARTGFYPSMAATLNHLLAVDLYYVGALYGEAFRGCLAASPVSCFVADGSEVSVGRGRSISAGPAAR